MNGNGWKGTGRNGDADNREPLETFQCVYIVESMIKTKQTNYFLYHLHTQQDDLNF